MYSDLPCTLYGAIYYESPFTLQCAYIWYTLYTIWWCIFSGRPCILCGAYFLLHPVYYLVHIFWYTLYSTGSWELKYTVFSLYTDLSKCLNHCNYTPPPFLHLPSSPLLSQIQICISFLTPPPPPSQPSVLNLSTKFLFYYLSFVYFQSSPSFLIQSLSFILNKFFFSKSLLAFLS